MKRPKTLACNGPGRRDVLAALSAVAAWGATAAWAAAEQTAAQQTAAQQAIRIGYLRWTERRATISILDQPAPDSGLAGAKLATEDDNTTGRFTGQTFELVDRPVRADEDVAAALGELVRQDARLVLSDLPAAGLLKLADAARAQGVLLFNVAAPDDALRNASCRADVIHVAPSRQMLTDALGQYLIWKKWPRWFLVYGSHPEDALLADAYRRTARRFGARIVAEKVFRDTGESRQTDSGLIQTQQQMPLFTQGAADYDVLVAADENEVFAGYLPYRTWDARPVAGSAGLEPTTWDPSSEAWGGTQVQTRFVRTYKRLMRPLDMQAWTAVRMVGEAATRTQSSDAAKIAAYIKSPAFGVAAYKGQRLTLRDWDLQLRQPILLSDGRLVVSVSPQPGFLHQVTELDTLGYDKPETKCSLQ